MGGGGYFTPTGPIALPPPPWDLANFDFDNTDGHREAGR